ncbi:MAG: hypothetical protein OEU32_08885 [Acidimicrobiia bacterium]|nr:hypothetical protein [Acidimicrobiia bacterium]
MVAATIARRIGTAPTHVGAVPLATVVDPADFLGRLAAAGLTTERFVGAA